MNPQSPLNPYLTGFYPVASTNKDKPAARPDVTFKPYAVLCGTTKARYIVAVHPGDSAQPALYVDETDAQKLADQLNQP